MSGMELLAVAVLAASWAWFAVGARRARIRWYDGDDLTWTSATFDQVKAYRMWDEADAAGTDTGWIWVDGPSYFESVGPNFSVQLSSGGLFSIGVEEETTAPVTATGTTSAPPSDLHSVVLVTSPDGAPDQHLDTEVSPR